MSSSLDDRWETLLIAWRRYQETPVPDDALADTIGELESLQRRIRDHLARLRSEETVPTVGAVWQRVERRRARRTYNTDGLLAAAAGATGQPLARLIGDLVALDVIRIGWQWSKLRQWAGSHGIDLLISPREVGDGDPDALIGETWETVMTTEPAPAERKETP